MAQWYSKDLGDGSQSFAPTKEIHSAFIPMFIAAGQPIDMAVFSRNDLKRNIVTVYFSPSASALAKMFGASPCEKPKKENELGLLVGDQRCIELLYPTV